MTPSRPPSHSFVDVNEMYHWQGVVANLALMDTALNTADILRLAENPMAVPYAGMPNLVAGGRRESGQKQSEQKSEPTQLRPALTARVRDLAASRVGSIPSGPLY
eukprot:8536571-Pyramimonas_sp.AAC.1